ncbi:MAG: polymer-forming cytoskeletal protein [Bacteroidales bacterium]|nr:polymer-forming cytoskeletal protein [Bacteroidales bacterium]
MAKTMEPTVNVNEVSRISTGTVVKGEISSSNDIRIDGTFEGKIKSKGRVVVGEKALIKGDIICANVDFWGTMEGNFYVKDTLSLKSSSKVKGDLHIKRLQVELDARFDGTCQMITESDFDRLVGAAPAAAPQKPAAAPQPQPVQPK